MTVTIPRKARKHKRNKTRERNRRILRERRQRVLDRIENRPGPERDQPMMTASNIHYELAGRIHGLSAGGLGAMLQTRLMDVAEDAQTLAAALNHSAFNTANALGPWLGGMAIAAGYGWTSTGWVGAALALGGLAIWIVAVLDSRR